MGFLDTLDFLADSFSDAVEKKKDTLERNARRDYKSKVRSASDELLRCNLEKARETGNYIMEEEIENEMRRRGIY